MMTATWIALCSLSALAATPAPPPGGWVELPLARYDELVDRASRPTPPPVPAEALVFAERLTLRIEGDRAHVDATWELEFSGARPPSLRLSSPGAAERLTVTPGDSATIGWELPDAFVVTPLRAGPVTLRLEGSAPLQPIRGGAVRFDVPAPVGSVVEVTLDLAAGLRWRLPGAVVSEDVAAGTRRRVRLTRGAGESGPLELYGHLRIREEAPAYVRGVTVTMIEPGPDALARTDVVLYEVHRGSLAELALRLPAGFEPDPVATTDEGAVAFDVAADRLVLPRQNRLSGRGHLLLTSSASWPQQGAPLPVPLLEPEVEVRSRFLVVTAALAAEWAPRPESAWTRVDREDLPPTLREAVQGLALAAVWRLQPGPPPAGLELGITTLPPVAVAEDLVPSRRTVTVATVEGSLVHRDEFSVESGPAALEVVLPAGMEFWSAKVNGEPTRPVAAGVVQRIPLPPGRGQRHAVEIVAAEKRSLPAGKAKENFRLELPQVRGSVVRHEWRLMLPENRDYRLVGGELRAVPPSSPTPPPPPSPAFVNEVEVIEPGRIRSGSAVTAKELEQIPTASSDPWVILQNAPGVLVDRVNVGGNESGQQSTFLGPLPVQAKVPETGKAVLLSGALPPPTVTVTIESRPLKKKGRR